MFDCFPDTEPVFGGAPFNVAWHLRAFGENPQLISAVGNDELGRKIRQAMQEWQLSQDYLQIHKNRPTGVVNVNIDHGEPTYDIKPDCAYDFIEAEHLPVLESPSLLYHGSLAARGEVSKNSLRILQQDKHHKRFIDVNLRSPWWRSEDVIASINYAHCVKLNSDELSLLAGAENLDNAQDSDCLAIAGRFKQQNNIVNLLLTRGERGATLIDADGEVYSAAVPPLAKAMVDTVGAGDAFAAVTILGIQQGWDWQTTLERAQQFASFIVTQRGAISQNLTVYRDFRNFWHVS